MKSVNLKRLHYFLLLSSVAIVFWKYLICNHLFIFTGIGSDTMTLFYPNLLEDVRNIRSEGISMWSFSKGIGQVNFSERILLPFTWLFVLMGEKYLAYGIGWVQMSKVLLIGFVMYHLMRFQGMSWKTCFLASALMCFSGYVMIGSSWYGHTTRILFSLMLLLGIEMWLSKRQWWLIPISMLFLIGPSLLFAFQIVIIYLLIRLNLSDQVNFRKIKQLILHSWKPILVGLLISAPFLGSRVYALIYSPRVGGEDSLAGGLSSSGIFDFNTGWHYATIIGRFFSNDLLGVANAFSGWNNYLEAPIFYCGLSTLLLAPQVFTFVKKKQKIVFAAIFGLGLLVLIFPYFRYALYLFAGDYYKSGLSLYVPFVLIWMACLAFEHIIKGRKINLILLGATSLGLLAFLFSLTSYGKPATIDNGIRTTVLIFLIFQIAVLCSQRLFLSQRTFWYVFIALLLVEGVVLSFPALNDRQSIPKESFSGRNFYNDYTKEALTYFRSIDSDFYRVQKTFGSFQTGYNDSQAQGFFDTKSYRSHNHKNYVSFYRSLGMMEKDENATRWISGINVAPELHPFFQVKYMISKQGDDGSPSNQYYEPLGDLNGLNLFKNKTPVPFGFAVQDYITESEFNALDSWYAKLNVLYRTAVIKDQEVSNFPNLKKRNPSSVSSALALRSYSAKSENNSLNIEDYRQDRILGSINLDEPSMLIFSMPFDNGWKAWVNKKTSRLHYVDNGMTGLYLEAGESDIALRYRPPFYKIGVLLFFVGIGLFIILKRFKQNNNQLLPPFLIKDISPALKNKKISKSKAKQIKSKAKTKSVSKNKETKSRKKTKKKKR